MSRRKNKMPDPSDLLTSLLEERERASKAFNEATDRALIDAAIYELASIEARINKILVEIRGGIYTDAAA